MTRGQVIATDVAALLRARNPLLWVVTREEARVERHLIERHLRLGMYPVREMSRPVLPTSPARPSRLGRLIQVRHLQQLGIVHLAQSSVVFGLCAICRFGSAGRLVPASSGSCAIWPVRFRVFPVRARSLPALDRSNTVRNPFLRRRRSLFLLDRLQRFSD